MAARFSADLYGIGVYVVEEVGPPVGEPSPDQLATAWHGVIIAESSGTDGERGWVVARTDRGRNHPERVLADREIHTCQHDGCPRCPRFVRWEVPRLLADLLRQEAAVGHKRTEADRRRADRIRSLVALSRKALMR